MYYRKALCAQQENVDQGTLQITVHSKQTTALWKMHWSVFLIQVIQTVSLKKSARILPATPCPSIKNASSGIQPECFRGGAALCRIFHADQSRGFSPGGNRRYRSLACGSGQTACPSESQARHCFGKQNCHSSPYTFL